MNTENENDAFQNNCPSCHTMVEGMPLFDHVSQCLQKFQRLPSSSVSNDVNSSSSSGSQSCYICTKDLTLMNFVRQSQHINRCQQAKDDENNQRKETRRKNIQDVTLSCPVCGKICLNKNKRLLHMKTCARNNNLTTEQLLTAVKLHKKQLDERKSVGLPNLHEGQAVSGAKRKPSSKKSSSRKTPKNEDVQVALALSLSEQEQEKNMADAERRLLASENSSEQESTNGASVEDVLKSLLPVSAAKKPNNRRKKKFTETPPLVTTTHVERQELIQRKLAEMMSMDAEDNREFYLLPPLRENFPVEEFLRLKPSKLAQRFPREMRLWDLSHLDDIEDLSQFYVSALRNVISPSKVVIGSKFKALSQIPGRRTSNIRKSLSWVNDQVPSEPTVSSADTDTNLTDENGISDKGMKVDENVKRLLSDYSRLVGSSDFSDVTVIASDGVVPAHKVILAARYPQIMLQIGSSDKLDMHEYTKEAVRCFLNYVYAATTSHISRNLFPDVLNIAKNFHMEELVSYIEQSIRDKNIRNDDDSERELNVLLQSLCRENEAYESVCDEDSSSTLCASTEESNFDDHVLVGSEINIKINDNGFDVASNMSAIEKTENSDSDERRGKRDSESIETNFNDSDSVKSPDLFVSDSETEKFNSESVPSKINAAASCNPASNELQFKNSDDSLRRNSVEIVSSDNDSGNRDPSAVPEQNDYDSISSSDEGDNTLRVGQSDGERSRGEIAGKSFRKICVDENMSLLSRLNCDSNSDEKKIDAVLLTPKNGTDDERDVNCDSNSDEKKIDAILLTPKNRTDDERDVNCDSNSDEKKIDAVLLTPKNGTDDERDVNCSTERDDCQDDDCIVVVDRTDGNLKNDELSGKENDSSESNPKDKMFKKRGESRKRKKAERKTKIEAVTPLPHYSIMETPELKGHLSKYGLKKLRKKDSVKILKHIYEETHPMVTDSEEDDDGGRITCSQTVSQPSVFKPQRISSSQPVSSSRQNKNNIKKGRCEDGEESENDLNNSSDNADGQHIPEESTIVDEPLSSTQDNTSLSSKLRSFVNEHYELRRKILTYEPIILEDLHEELKSSGIKHSLASLMDVLDKQCITFRIKNGGRRQKTKKRKC